MLGPRQRQIVEFLRDGPASLNAIVARIPGKAGLVQASVYALQSRGLVVLTGNARSGAMVALVAEPASGSLRHGGANRQPSEIVAAMAGITERLRT